MQFKAGDTVQLRSGGPIMSVASVDAISGMVFCTWQERGQTTTKEFAPGTLKLVSPPKPIRVARRGGAKPRR